MKIRHGTFLAAAALGCLLAAPLAAENERTLPANYERASHIIGKKVENPSGENLGKIEDVVLDTRNGKIAYAVLSFGGFLGIGDKFFAVPWDALRGDAERSVCVLSVDKEKLKNAPGFDQKNWPNMSDPRLEEELRRFYRSPSTSATDPGTRTYPEFAASLRDLEREPVHLALDLREGTKFSYMIDHPDFGKSGPARGEATATPPVEERERREGAAAAAPMAANLRLTVMKVSGNDADVEIACTSKEAKSCTVTVSKDGSVKFKDKETGSEPSDAAKEEQFKSLVRHIFGDGLHRDKLEPGKEYVMQGSFHGVGAHSTGTAGREATARTTEARSDGSHRMRFEGVARKEGEPRAVFSILGTSTEGTPEIRPAAGTESAARARELAAAGDRPFGLASYRLDDGLLEKFMVGNCKVRRVDDRAVSPGN